MVPNLPRGNAEWAPPHGPTRRILRGDPTGGELSPLDAELIEYLQADGRAPYAELARMAGVTEKTVRRKVARLLDEDFIQIVAVTDPALLGYGAMGLVDIRMDASGATTAELADALSAIPEVDYVTVTTGRFAVHAELVCADTGTMQRVVDEKIRTLPGVRDVEVLAFLRLQYQQARFSGVDVASEEAGVRPLSLDESDRRIITQLCLDGRTAFRDIARELDASETMVRQRYQRMLSEGAVKVMAIANPLRLGFQAVGWVAINVASGAKVADVVESLTELTNVTYVAITAGRFDALIEVVCPDVESMLTVVDDGVRSVEGIRDTEVWMYTDLRYKPLLPHADGT